MSGSPRYTAVSRLPASSPVAEKRIRISWPLPGRLLDHMGRGTVYLGNVYTAVLDEADEMLKMGFIWDVRRILGATPRIRRW